MRWLLLLVLPGCFSMIAPKHDVETPLSVHVMPIFVGPVRGVALNITTSYATLHVDASLTRECFREVRQLVEHRDEASSYGQLLGFDAVIANIGAETSTEDRTLSVTKTDCSIPAAGAKLAVEMPSGAIVRAVTDARGLAHIKIPATEPASGIAIVHARGATPTRVAYSPAN
jgi:hypothetical protein